MESNSQNPNKYEIFDNSEGFYFITEQGVTYTVYFLTGENYFPNQTYSTDLYVFGFQSNFQNKSSFDKKVGLTIIEILLRFFSNNKNLIAYSCDQSDKKEIARKKLFDKWFNA